MAAARRRCSVSALLQARIAVLPGSAVCGGTRVAGADVLSAVVRGSHWSCRLPGRVGGSQAPPARGGGAGPRAVA